MWSFWLQEPNVILAWVLGPVCESTYVSGKKHSPSLLVICFPCWQRKLYLIMVALSTDDFVFLKLLGMRNILICFHSQQLYDVTVHYSLNQSTEQDSMFLILDSII